MSDHTPSTTNLQASDDLATQALASVNDGNEVAASDEIAETIISLQNVIERNAEQLDAIKKDLKLIREQLKDVFENDSALSEAQQQATVASSQVKEHRSRLQSDPTVTRLKVELNEKQEQKKDIEEALSDHLVNYFSLTNSKSFDTSDGDQREFVIKASVKGRSK